MSTVARLTLVETRLLLRDWAVVGFNLVFPALLLVVLGLIPGFTDPDPDLNGGRLIDLYLPIVLVLAFVFSGISAAPSILVGYREQGVLRRLRLTPVGPTPLLVASLLANLLFALVASLGAVVAAIAVYDVRPPASWGGVLATLVLAPAALFALGMILAAVAPTASVANAVSPLVWLPIMVLAGLWFPREAMPDLMRTISDYSPGGAAVDAMQRAWFVGAPTASSLLVLAVCAVVAAAVAARLFRWE
ncbi:MAG TPA: ABC transporter permease [Egicoccus sp.]|nr:ABC transporter permease [Egicoccus sp.]HSK24309.1 ABC transporter permease [Egicoccus sp.]